MSDLTLGAVFGFEEPSAKESSLSRSAGVGIEFLAKAIGAIPALGRFRLTREVARTLADKLAIPVQSIFLKTWNKRAEILKYRDTEKYPEGKVELTKHDLTQTVHPKVTFKVKGIDLPSLVVTGTVTFTIHSAVLVIRQAAITGIEIGKVTARMELSAGDATLVKRDLGELHFERTLTLREPVTLKANEATAA